MTKARLTILSRLLRPSGAIPIGTLALRADAGFVIVIARNPFMIATLAGVLINCDFFLCHAVNIYLK